jgi:Mrp family chromosome partitioning ATPase
LGAPLSPGLSEYLRDEATEADVIQHGQEGNLCFIAGGNGAGSNASELLSNGRFQKLLDRVAPLFDWVIIDSPPCLPVADASVLAGCVDGVLLVVRSKSTPFAMSQKARQELRKSNVIGAVLNFYEEVNSYGGYYSYGRGQSGEKTQGRTSSQPSPS